VVHQTIVIPKLTPSSFLPIVSNSEEKKFAAIIDAILETADLETISQRKVRQALEGRLGGRDLSDQKVRSLPVPASLLGIHVFSLPRAICMDVT
jgi:hypothetical protein